jgi:hyperosmotically inducible periplasmic protein
MRTILIVLVLAIAGFLLLGYSNATWWRSRTEGPAPATGTTGTIDKEKARERGAELGEKAAIATEHIREAAHETTVTTKIKAKMALDDSVKSRTIDVSTDGSTVTLSGSVGSAAERRRAAALARETDGVQAVIDRLVIESH